MKKFADGSWAATSITICLRADDTLDFGTAVHESRTGLTGVTRHLLGPGDRMIQGYRDDSIPTLTRDSSPETFFLYKGHGMNPDRLVLVEMTDFGRISIHGVEDGKLRRTRPSNDPFVVKPPWWGASALNGITELWPVYADCWSFDEDYARDVAWAWWRDPAGYNPDAGIHRGGVRINWEVVYSQPNRPPFCTIDGLTRWVGCPPRKGKVGGLIHPTRGTHRVSDWDAAMSVWGQISEAEGPMASLGLITILGRWSGLEEPDYRDAGGNNFILTALANNKGGLLVEDDYGNVYHVGDIMPSDVAEGLDPNVIFEEGLYLDPTSGGRAYLRRMIY